MWSRADPHGLHSPGGDIWRCGTQRRVSRHWVSRRDQSWVTKTTDTHWVTFSENKSGQRSVTNCVQWVMVTALDTLICSASRWGEERGQMVLSQWDAGLAGPGYTWSFVSRQDPALSPRDVKPLSSVGCTHKRKIGWLAEASPLSHHERAGNGAEIRTDLFSIWYVWDWDKGDPELRGGRCEARAVSRAQETAGPCQDPPGPRPR